METFEVNIATQIIVKRLVSGFVLRQDKRGKHYIKVSKGQRSDIKKYLGLTLTNHLNR